MTRPIHSGRVSVDTTSQLFSLANGATHTTVYLAITDGGGAGTNTLTITFEGCPNPNDSDATKIFITDEVTSFPSTVIDSSTDLPYYKIIKYEMNGWGRFNFDYGGGGTKVFTVIVYVNP